ncbi:MAG TPA: RIP metalloprotease RseP [Steroidobacteraceae bacterium]
MDIVWKILWGLIGIGVLVTIHEFGHYWVARKLGFKVLRFSVGFGKPLWKRIGRAPDHIEYVVAAVPLGGYVRMADERDGDVAPADRPRAFTGKPPWQRILVLLAGPAANILFAIVVLSAMIWLRGMTQIKPVIGDVTLDKPAAEAGLRTRDLVLAVNGEPVSDEGQFQFKLLAAVSGDGPVMLRVQSVDGRQRNVVIPLLDDDERFELTRPNKLMRGLGIDYWEPPTPARITAIIPNGPAHRAGLRPGDLVVAIDGHATRTWNEVARYVRERPEQELSVRVKRGEEELTVSVTPIRQRDNGEEVGLLQMNGARAPLKDYPSEYVVKLTPGLFQSLGDGTAKAWEMTAAQATFFWRMLTKRISTDNLTSLLTIADYAGQKASEGPASFLTLLVLLSLSLGFFNLLPIPILDGGQIVFQAAEWIRGRPLSDRAYMLGQQAGLVAIVLLMGVALFNDLSTYLFPGAGK